jgi:type IV secretory pathway TraG/TraD family ATPase VirD4
MSPDRAASHLRTLTSPARERGGPPWLLLALLLAGAWGALEVPGPRPWTFLLLLVLFSSIPLALALAGRWLGGGGAAFAPVGREFGRPDSAVAALLVHAARGRARRLGSVEGVLRPRLAYLRWDVLSRHVLVYGNTGSGKTTGVFNHLMLSSRVPWIYQDQKAEMPLAAEFSDRPVWGLDTRGYRSRSLVWNPLREARTPEDVEVLAALLIPDRGDEYDWVVRSARFLFESLLLSSPFGSLQEVGRLLESEAPEGIAERLPRGARSVLADPRQRGYFLSSLREVLHPFLSPRVARVTEGEPSVALDDFISRGGYVLGNEDRSLRAAVTLFWGLLLNRLRSRPPSAGRLLLLLDEFGDAGRIPNMASALALYRSKNVGIVAGVQTPALLKSVYRDEWEAVREGFGTLLVLTANLPAALQSGLTRELGRRGGRDLSFSWSPSGPSLSLGPPRDRDLVPQGRWGAWGRAHACLARAQEATWWLPEPVALAPAPWERESDGPGVPAIAGIE